MITDEQIASLKRLIEVDVGMHGIGFSIVNQLIERLDSAENALKNTSKERAIIIFADEEEHVQHFCRHIDSHFKSVKSK